MGDIFSETPNSLDPSQQAGPKSTGNIFLDVLGTVANWDILRRTGLPQSVDGARITPVSDIEQQRTEITPPAPPGGVTGFRLGDISGSQLAVGGAVLVGLVGLALLLRK